MGQIFGPMRQRYEQVMLEFIAHSPKWFSIHAAITEYIEVQPCYALDPYVQIFLLNPFEERVRQNQQFV